MPDGFVHLSLHTEYSMVDGIVRIPDLVRRVRDLGMPAVAVTDQSNLFALVKFFRQAQAGGVKPVVGVELRIAAEREAAGPERLLLLCRDWSGYLNMTALVTRVYREGQGGQVPCLRREWLQGHSDGLIALSGGRHGVLGEHLLGARPDVARRELDWWRELFPDSFYIELQRTGRPGEEDFVHAAVELALRQRAPVVATNDVRFLDTEDFEAHEARVCIHEGRVLSDSRRPRMFSDQQYLRGPQEMIELFSDIPEAIENTVAIAQRCNIELKLGQNYLPDFPLPDGVSIDDWFAQEAERGLEARFELLIVPDTPDPDETRTRYLDRLRTEVEVIRSMGYPGYFLIVADFIRWAKENGIPVGPGRGSGAGSLVAYAMGITDLDPIRYDLLFERFLNPERVSLPDFDVDFCMERRDEVIAYVAQRYGRDRVSQIITYGTMAAKAVVRDVGRVLGHPYGFTDKLAKLIPFDLKMTLDRALDEEAELRERYEQEDEVRALIDLARKLEGITRNAGKHAGGVVIAPSLLTDFTPLYCEKGSDVMVTQFDKDDVEAVGLVKFDFLGLRTLTIIDWAVKAINAREDIGEPVDITRIPLDDEAAFHLLKRCATTAVFQLESRGMKDLIKRLQPDSFDDIIALVALFRPGPLQSGMVDDFVSRKHGRSAVEYAHPDLEPILKSTYGVILYQEQVMQIAQVLAGYTLGAADLLRRAMGKKKPEEMAKQRSIFVEGALRHGVEEKTATHIFDLMEKFAGYGFNKSHSAAYALVSYQTAWLKAHYPAEFMAAVLSADMDNTDKVVILIDECRSMKLDISPPDINHSRYPFTASGSRTIRYGLGAIKGVGQSALEAIIAERDANGHWTDLFDFCRRIDARKVNRRVIEALIKSGALDALGPGRSRMMAALEPALRAAEQAIRAEAAGQNDMFGLDAGAVDGDADGDEYAAFPDVPPWREEERLLAEMETLGLYLTGHPVTRYERELEALGRTRLVDLKPAGDQPVLIGGLVCAVRTLNSRRGPIAFVTLDDRTARAEVMVYSEQFQEYRELLVKNRLLVVEGSAGTDERTGGVSITARTIYDIEHARDAFARCLVVQLDASQPVQRLAGELIDALEPFACGRIPVAIAYQREDARARLSLGGKWRVRVPDELLRRLGDLVGADRVRVMY